MMLAGFAAALLALDVAGVPLLEVVALTELVELVELVEFALAPSCCINVSNRLPTNPLPATAVF